MLDRRRLVQGIVFGLALAAAGTLSAGEAGRFTPAALTAAQAGGKPILVEVSAPWCPTCKAQKPILERLRADARFKNLVVLQVDFDSQKDDLRALKAQRQSTLIVFKGATEVGRSVGDTNPGSIEALLAKAI